MSDEFDPNHTRPEPEQFAIGDEVQVLFEAALSFNFADMTNMRGKIVAILDKSIFGKTYQVRFYVDGTSQCYEPNQLQKV